MWKPVTATILVLAAFVGGLFWLDAVLRDQFAHRNLDPRVGPVLLVPNGSEWKQCDGTTLVYRTEDTRSTGISAVADSEECSP